MDIASQESYRSSEGYTLPVFDLRGSATAKHLRHQHSVRQEYGNHQGHIENHYVLIFRPGSARRVAL